MTNASYIVTSLTWSVYGFVMGFGVTFLARLMWDRK